MATSRFADIQQAPPIEVFHVMKAFADSTHEKKVNLSVGGEEMESLSSVLSFCSSFTFIYSCFHRFHEVLVIL